MWYSGHILSCEFFHTPTHSCRMLLALTMFDVADWASQYRPSSVTPSGTYLVLLRNSCNVCPCRVLVKLYVSIRSMVKCSSLIYPLFIQYLMNKYLMFMYFSFWLRFMSHFFLTTCLTCCPGLYCYLFCTLGTVWNWMTKKFKMFHRLI